MTKLRQMALATAGIGFALAGLTHWAAAQDVSHLVACTAGADCDAKWTRASQWVKDNSKYPITVNTATEISTVARTGFGDRDLILTVNKFARKDGTFVLGLRAGCGTVFGACNPTIKQAQDSFARYVGSSSPIPVPPALRNTPSVAATAPGIRAIPLAGSVPAATANPENPERMQLFCRGGGHMTVHFGYRADKDGNTVVLEVPFTRANHGARQGDLIPGECAFADRGLRDGEPALISVAGSAAGLGFDMRVSSDRRIMTYAVQGVGGIHDAIGVITNGVLNSTDFSLSVSDTGTLSLKALTQ